MSRDSTSPREMPIYDGARVRERVFFEGYQQSLWRFYEAVKRDEHRQSFFALFEALNWAHALDDVIAEIFRPQGGREGLDWRRWIEGSEVLAGLRYARNRVHHQWADALAEPESAGKKILPFDGGPHVWRRVEDLPDAPKGRKDPRGRKAYDEQLAGKPAALALAEVDQVFGQVLNSFLDPPRAVSRPPIVSSESPSHHEST